MSAILCLGAALIGVAAAIALTLRSRTGHHDGAAGVYRRDATRADRLDRRVAQYRASGALPRWDP